MDNLIGAYLTTENYHLAKSIRFIQAPHHFGRLYPMHKGDIVYFCDHCKVKHYNPDIHAPNYTIIEVNESFPAEKYSTVQNTKLVYWE